MRYIINLNNKYEKKEIETMKKYVCNVCGAEFEVAEGEDVVCPVCGVGEEDCEVVEEN